jgi:hypothetical protein
MKRCLCLALMLLAVGIALPLHAEEQAAPEMPEMPQPVEQHKWLQRLVGEWDFEATMSMGEDTEPMKCSGTETVRDLDGFWAVCEGQGNMMGNIFTNILTIGYDTAKGSYVATFISSGADMLWVYTGTVDGDKLVLETSGPCPMQGGRIAKFRETMELKGKDKRTFTSESQLEDGSWVKFMTMEYTRKK